MASRLKINKKVNNKPPGLFAWVAFMMVVIITGAGIIIMRFSQAAAPAPNTPIPAGGVYWLGDSLSYGLQNEGALQSKLTANNYNPNLVNADPGRSITRGGKSKGQSGLAAVDADKEFIRKARSVVIFLGTNPDDNFEVAQRDLLSKLSSINSGLRVVWIDIAASGNSQWGESIYNYAAGGRVQKAAEYNKQIYQNVSKFALAYNVISQYAFVWGSQTSPSELAQRDFPDPNGLMLEDGVHYTSSGYIALANYLVSAMQKPSFASYTIQNDNQIYDLSQTSLKNADVFSLKNESNTLVAFQVGGFCQQITFSEKFGSGKGCLVGSQSAQPVGVRVVSPQFKQLSAKNAKKVCIATSSKTGISKIIAEINGTAYELQFLGNTLFACTADSDKINYIPTGQIDIKFVQAPGSRLNTALVRVTVLPI